MFKINNLTYQYDKTRKALNNVSMDFNKGNIIGIIGSNGSGKSTLFNNLMGILKSTEGEILYNGEQIKYDKKSLYNLRKEVGIVFQDPEKQIFYSMVYDDIAFALRNIGIDEKTIKERIHTALEAVNGLQFIDRPVHNLSFGQKKRVAIASVVAMENKLVLLDEPTAGLDPISTRAIVDIIKGLNKRGVKIVISSHDMNLIYEICDYVYVLNQGVLINEGTREEVFINEEKIDELAASIKENGLIQPIVVRKNNGVYQIIAGERRYRACRLLNMKQVPCIIEDYTDKQTQTLAIIENIQREDLSPLEEAKAYQALIKEYGYSQTELADIVGKKQSTIANKLRLLKLSDDVKFSLNQKQITERHARAMLSLNEEKQQEVLREVLKKKLTVADTERLIKKEPKPKKKKASADVKKTISRNVKIALNTLQQAIGMIEKTGTSLQQETEDLEDEYVITIRIHK